MSNVALLRSQIEASLAGRIPSALTPRPKREQESISCGIPEIDSLNAFPRGTLVEICGLKSTGGTRLVHGLLASVTQLGEAAVLLDVRDAFDPVSASQNGVVLSQLLWVRPGGGASATSTRRRFAALDQVLMAADLLLQSGGFGLVVLDLASLEPRDTVKIPLTTWFRLRRAVDETRTLLLVLEQAPHAGSSAVVVLDLAQAGVKFLETRTAKGTAQHVDGDCLIESIALDAEIVRGQARKPVASVRSRASFSTSLQFYR